MRTSTFPLLILLLAATLYSQTPARTPPPPEGSQADRDSLLATEMENNAPHTPEEQIAILKRNMWDGTTTSLSPTGMRLGRTSTILEGIARRAQDTSGVKRENKLTNYVVNVYNGTTGLIGYDKEVVETGHPDASQNKSTFAHCMDVFVKRENHWYGLSNNCFPYEPAAK